MNQQFLLCSKRLGNFVDDVHVFKVAAKQIVEDERR
jgi:hypothetical protein